MVQRAPLSALFFVLAGCAASAPPVATEPPGPEAEDLVGEPASEPAAVEAEPVAPEESGPSCSSEDGAAAYYACAEDVAASDAGPRQAAPTPVDSRIVMGVEVEGDVFPSDDFAGIGLPGISRDGQLIAMPQVDGDGHGDDTSVLILHAEDASMERIHPISSSGVEDPDDDVSFPEGRRRARVAAGRADRFLVRQGMRSMTALPLPGDPAIEGLPYLVWHERTLMLREPGPGSVRWRGDPPEVPWIPLVDPDGEPYVDPCDYSYPTEIEGWMLPDGEHALLRFTTNPAGDECFIRLEYRVVALD